MNIEKIFKNKTEIENKEYNLKLNNQMLLQLITYAIEDKEADFDNLIKKEINLMTNFGFYPEVFDTSFESSSQSVYVELDNADYSSFLEASIDLLPTKYIKKVALNIKKQDFENFLKDTTRFNKTNIIKQCIIRNKKEALTNLLELGIVTEKGILQTIFLFERKNIKEYIDEEILNNPILLHEAFDGISFKNHDCILGKESINNLSLKKRGGFFYGNLIQKGLIIEALEMANVNNYKYKNEIIKNIINAFIIDFSTLNTSVNIFNEKNNFEEYLLDKNKKSFICENSQLKQINDIVFEFIKKDFFDMDEEFDIKLINNETIKFKFSNWFDFNEEQKKIIIEKRNKILSEGMIKRNYELKSKI